jgi:hypothetical protein
MRTMARWTLLVGVLVSVASSAATAWSHGFLISEVDSDGIPVGFTIASQSQVLDSASTPAPYANLFWDTLPNATKPDSLFTEGTAVSTPRSSPGAYYPVNDGSPGTAGPFSQYDSATFTVISPLLFSNGGAATAAPAGVSLKIVERFPGNAPNGATNATNHPGAATTATGLVTISGSTGIVPCFAISMADVHELAKDLFLGIATQTGEYGFAYTVTVNFHNGPSLTTGPLVDVFSLTDPSLAGGSFSAASMAVQDAATQAIYSAAVPEPSAFALAAGGIGLFVAGWQRRKSKS